MKYKHILRHKPLTTYKQTIGGATMATLKETALAYEGNSIKNIAELESVSTDLVLEDKEGLDKNQEKFKYKVAVIEGKEYRVPNVVLGSLKDILKQKPDLKFIKVIKSGEGKSGTRYTIIPLE